MGTRELAGKSIWVSLLALCCCAAVTITAGTVRAENQTGSVSVDETMPPANDVIMTLDQARAYVIALINRDRAANGLGPVALDPIATVAGQKHTDEMAAQGFISHWNKFGKKPDQRYTEAGGIHCDTENLSLRSFRGGGASADVDGKKSSFDGGGNYELHGVQAFRQSDLDRMQQAFMAEKPPNDGHRKCILDPVHNYVGIGLSLSSNGQENFRIALAQEFTNVYGQYDPIQQMCTRGQAITLSGRLNPGYEVYEVAFDWEPLPEPMDFIALDKTHTYVAGKKRLYRYWPPSPTESSPLSVNPLPDGRQQFRCAILPKGWKPGVYYAIIMAKPAGADYSQSFLASRRTIIIPAN